MSVCTRVQIAAALGLQSELACLAQVYYTVSAELLSTHPSFYFSSRF
jgi:hypothetical protein